MDLPTLCTALVEACHKYLGGYESGEWLVARVHTLIVDEMPDNPLAAFYDVADAALLELDNYEEDPEYRAECPNIYYGPDVLRDVVTAFRERLRAFESIDLQDDDAGGS